MKIRNLIPFKTSILSASINKFLGVALILLVLLTSSVASAQLFPVQVSPQLTPPYSLKLSDYSTTTSEKLLVNLLLTDVNESDLQVRLRFSISGNSVRIQSKDFVQNAAPIQLTGGIPLRLSNLDLQPYFDLQNLDGITPSEYSKPLPDGLYQFCFEVFDWTTGRPLSEKKCFPVYLVLNDPPFLNLPQNGEQVPAQDPQNLIFQWTPRHVNATGVEYEFELRELWDTNVDPQTAFLASPNLYQTTGFANTLLYGPGETSLLEGKTYGWRVRAVVSDGISETAVFKNGGYSEIFYFTYTGKCDAPQYILAKSEGTTTEEITWQQNPDHINYQIQFRKEGGSNNVWFESETVETKKKLFFLEAETTYEYRVGGQCVQNGGYSYSAVNTFTTPGKEDASEYNCGIPPEIVITNQDPLQRLGVNDVFTAGDFPVTVKEVNGGNGNYTGWGFIVVPYLGDTQIRVTFNNIQINTDKQLTNGIVETEYDEKFATTGGAGMSDVSELTELIEGDNDIDELNVNFVIPPDYFEDYITVEDGQVVITNPNDAQVRTSPLGDDKVIVDSAGNTYHVDAEGNVTKGGKIDEGGPVNADNVEGVTKNGDIESLTAKGITVTFNTKGTYGYDKLPTGINNTKLNEEYKTIKDAQGANYDIVNHVAEKNTPSLITATVSISNSGYTIDDLIFKTKQGELLTHTKATNNTINLSVQGRYTFENEPIYAVVKSKQDTTKQQTAGAFNLWHLSRKTVDVVLVSVDGAQLPTAIELNTIFNQAATTLNIETKSVSLTNGLLGADNKLEIGDKPWLNTYNQEQKAIIADLKQKIDYQKDKYYVFTFNSGFNTTKSIAGFMPLKRQFGFVFNGGLSSDEEGKGDLAKVTAHEVAHGIFALQHPFTTYGDDIKGKTPWLMDYANGDLLSHMDWAQIHNPNLKFYIFQDEEDGESVLLFSIPEEHKNQDDPSFTFLRLDGGFITLPETVKDVIFTTGLDSFNNFVEMPVGALYGFTIDSVKYTANIVRGIQLEEVVIVAGSGSTSEAPQSNYSEITKNDLTFSFNGYSDEYGNFYDNEESKKYYNKLITYLPTSIYKGLFSIGIYDLIYKEPSSVNLIDDYDKFIFKDYTINGSTTYDYQSDTPFRTQHNLARELTEPVLDGSPIWTDKRPILLKYAELNNANPSIFKEFFSDKYKTADYTSVLKSTSLDSLKVEYIELINYFISKRKSLLEDFINYSDNEDNESKTVFATTVTTDKNIKKLLEVSKMLSSEQISEIIIDYRIKGLSKLLRGVKTANFGDLDAQYQNQIFRLLTLIPENQEEELYTFLTKESYKKFWDYAENLDEAYLIGFMSTYTSLINKFGSAKDRLVVFKELKQREDSWTGQGDDFGNKTEQVISGLTTNLTVFEGENITDAITRLEQQKQIIKYFREEPSFLRYAFDAMDNYNDVAPLTNFINTITYWDYQTESNNLRDINAFKIKYDSVNWVKDSFTDLPRIDVVGYIPFSRANWIKDDIGLFSFETTYKPNNKIHIELKIRNVTFITRDYDPLEYVALHIIEDFKSGGYEFKKGELYNVPAIYIHWLDNDIDRVQNLAAFRVAGSVLSIALAPVTFGGSTLLIGIDVALAVTDIYMTVNREELIAAGHQEALELWDATYAIYNIQFLPGAIKSVASGGKAFFNFAESLQGSLKFRKLVLNKEYIDNAVSAFKSIDNLQDKITFIDKLDDLIKAVKNTRVNGVDNITKNLTHNTLVKFKLKLHTELKKNLDIIVDNANTDFKPTLFIKSNNVNHELGLIEFINTPNGSFKNTIQLVESNNWLPSNVKFTDIGEIENIKYSVDGLVKEGKIKIVQDINNSNKFYLKPSADVLNTNPLYKTVKVSPNNSNLYPEGFRDIAINEIVPMHGPRINTNPNGVSDAIKALNTEGFKVLEPTLINPVRVVELPDGTKIIMDGHHRVLGMKTLEETNVPVLYTTYDKIVENISSGGSIEPISNLYYVLTIGKKTGNYKGDWLPEHTSLTNAKKQELINAAEEFIRTDFPEFATGLSQENFDILLNNVKAKLGDNIEFDSWYDNIGEDLLTKLDNLSADKIENLGKHLKESSKLAIEIKKNPSLVDSWELLLDTGRTGGTIPANALTRNIDAIETLHKLRSNVNVSKFGITDEMLAAIRGTDSYSYTQLLDELEKVLDILPADKTTNFSQVIQTGTQRGLINNNPVNGIYDRRHSVLTFNTIIANEAMFRAADKIEFEAVLETIDGIPQSVPDIKLTINNKVKIGEVYAGTAGAKSNLASQSLTYFQQIDDINDLRFFRRMNLAEKATAKSAVINSWKNGVTINQKVRELFTDYYNTITNVEMEVTFTKAQLENFLSTNDDWFELMFNSSF
ncbi:MAG: hypothetical protein ACSHW4_09740 [Cellulophaga sp.]